MPHAADGQNFIAINIDFGHLEQTPLRIVVEESRIAVVADKFRELAAQLSQQFPDQILRVPEGASRGASLREATPSRQSTPQASLPEVVVTPRSIAQKGKPCSHVRLHPLRRDSSPEVSSSDQVMAQGGTRQTTPPTTSPASAAPPAEAPRQPPGNRPVRKVAKNAQAVDNLKQPRADSGPAEPMQEERATDEIAEQVRRRGRQQDLPFSRTRSDQGPAQKSSSGSPTKNRGFMRFLQADSTLGDDLHHDLLRDLEGDGEDAPAAWAEDYFNRQETGPLDKLQNTGEGPDRGSSSSNGSCSSGQPRWKDFLIGRPEPEDPASQAQIEAVLLLGMASVKQNGPKPRPAPLETRLSQSGAGSEPNTRPWGARKLVASSEEMGNITPVTTPPRKPRDKPGSLPNAGTAMPTGK